MFTVFGLSTIFLNPLVEFELAKFVLQNLFLQVAHRALACSFGVVFFEHLLGTRADSSVLVVKKLFERLAALTRDDALPRYAAFQIAQGLPICEFLSAQFRALATDVTGMAAT
jgi:hypothetical protein